MKKIVGSTLNLSTKPFSHWTSTNRKIWVENSVFTIQHIENRKRFTEVLSNCVYLDYDLYSKQI